MRANRLRDMWAAGETMLNGWLHIPSSWSAEVMAHAGFDSVTIDLQHGLTGYQQAVHMLQALNTTDVVTLARCTWNEPVQIGRLLDAGVYGIICPMVNNRAEAEAFVGAVRYPPLGYRSLGPTRARLVAGADYPQMANETILALAMVETAAALENLDEILQTPGLDGVFVGPGDLRLSLTGKAGMDLSDPVLVEALGRIAERTRAHGRLPAIWVPNSADGRTMQTLGYQLITLSADSRLLAAAAEQIISEMRPDPE
jgi:4-hydroxy-2-oxoheptanedioate aldolase